MIVINLPEIKKFMSSLLKSDFFDSFEVRRVTIQTFSKVEIDGTLCKEFYDEDEQKDYEGLYFSSWGKIKPIVYELIKGKKMPKLLKIILSVPEKKLAEIHENASSLFININFEDNSLCLITGASQKNFSLDKSVDNSFDEFVFNLLKDFNPIKENG